MCRDPSANSTTRGLTELLYTHDLALVRKSVHEYLETKRSLWILIDNLDKGWPPHGIDPHDLLLLRCLIDAITKLERSLQSRKLDCHGIVFIRNDVYELMVEATPDRGKLARVNIDWSDPEMLRELIRRRVTYSTDLPEEEDFNSLWGSLCVSHIDGEESSQYLVERSLMRPRNLIDLVRECRGHAVNLGRDKITEDDLRRGEEAYSNELVHNIGFEIRDVAPNAEDILYTFLGGPSSYTRLELLSALGEADDAEELMELLLWWGVLGVRSGSDVNYIHSVNYNLKRLRILANRETSEFSINPAFWAGLDIQRPST